MSINARVPKKVEFYSIFNFKGYGVQNKKMEENLKENEESSLKGLNNLRLGGYK
jgi:hypothetical protein